MGELLNSPTLGFLANDMSVHLLAVMAHFTLSQQAAWANIYIACMGKEACCNDVSVGSGQTNSARAAET